ncbi:hypothetical protein EDM59_03880 [Brevibacillus nitrificans]|uniref:DUF3566 domain-containing protein n=1 Tax=Brevibacillus nitrificans TaxID=651560 RepID=A0A3M8DKX0_9BACL|nr:hypothetical protein [Brevibacillus nitrificans]RNB88279.1 hypothetical protein EDM59_03880 [Brevibacillus nitrificans]
MEKKSYDRVTLKSLKISSYIKLCVVAGLAIGLLVAIFQFVIALLNVTATANIGSIVLTGLPAALMILIITPFLTSFYALFFSLISYPPLLFLLRKMNGIVLEGVFEGAEGNENEGNP